MCDGMKEVNEAKTESGNGVWQCVDDEFWFLLSVSNDVSFVLA